MTSWSLALAEPDDAEALAALINRAYRGETSRLGWTTEADLLAGKRADAAMLRDLMASCDNAVWLARAAGEIRGTISLLYHDVTVEFSLFAVEPNAQAQGIGKRLLQQAEDYARQRWQAQRATLSVIACRHELIAYYQRRGYRLTGKYQAFPVDSNLWTPRVAGLQLAILEKDL